MTPNDTHESLPKPKISDEVAREIGRLVAIFNWFEWSVVDLLEQVAAPKVPADVLVSAMMYRSIVETTISAVEWACVNTNQDLGKRMIAALRRAEALASFRNDLAHGVFLSEELLGWHALFKRKRNSGAATMISITSEAVRGKGDEIEALGDEINSLAAEYIAAQRAAGHAPEAR
jgi:hypothetical protein